MDERQLLKLFRELRRGRVSPERAVEAVRHMPFQDLGFAKIDMHRALRKGFPEVIWGEGKSAGHLTKLIREYRRHGQNVLATRVSTEKARVLRRRHRGLRYDAVSRTLTHEAVRWRDLGKGTIAVVTAGTSDLPVAEEAFVTARIMGNRVERMYDVGVAGIHRLFNHGQALMKARVVIVVAGMEGALASVVGGLVSAPVIAVPTSVGYGANFGGISALLGMLTSCAPGMAVVNIDNGFGAGYLAATINRM